MKFQHKPSKGGLDAKKNSKISIIKREKVIDKGNAKKNRSKEDAKKDKSKTNIKKDISKVNIEKKPNIRR